MRVREGNDLKCVISVTDPFDYYFPSRKKKSSLENNNVWIMTNWKMFKEMGLLDHLTYPGASLIAQLVKNLLAVQETPVQSLGQEDPLEKG